MLRNKNNLEKKWHIVADAGDKSPSIFSDALIVVEFRDEGAHRSLLY
jgi:hypothetical protein